MQDAAQQPDEEPVSEGQLQAMVSLLSDSNEKVLEGCCDGLVRQGERALPFLRHRLPLAAPREERVIRSVLARIRHPHAAEDALEHLLGPVDLEEGSLLLGRLVDGGTEVDDAPGLLDAMSDRVDELLMGDDDPARQLAVLRRVLVDEYELQGSPPGRSRPVDALLHGVTAHRRGMPLPLCIAWILVARRVGVPLIGVNMPGHFLLRLEVPERLLVFDAYSGGRVVDPDACERQLTAHGVSDRKVPDLDADDREMLLRTVRNLVHLAASDRDRALALRATRLLARESRGRTA